MEGTEYCGACLTHRGQGLPASVVEKGFSASLLQRVTGSKSFSCCSFTPTTSKSFFQGRGGGGGGGRLFT